LIVEGAARQIRSSGPEDWRIASEPSGFLTDGLHENEVIVGVGGKHKAGWSGRSEEIFLKSASFRETLGRGSVSATGRLNEEGEEDTVIDSTNIFLECNYLDKHAVVLVKDDCLKMFSVIDHYFR